MHIDFVGLSVNFISREGRGTWMSFPRCYLGLLSFIRSAFISLPIQAKIFPWGDAHAYSNALISLFQIQRWVFITYHKAGLELHGSSDPPASACQVTWAMWAHPMAHFARAFYSSTFWANYLLISPHCKILKHGVQQVTSTRACKMLSLEMPKVLAGPEI